MSLWRTVFKRAQKSQYREQETTIDSRDALLPVATLMLNMRAAFAARGP